MPDPSDENQPPFTPSIPPAAPPPPPPAAEAPPPPPAAAGAFVPPASGGGERLPYGAGALSASDDKLFCILNHFLSIIIWLWKKDESPAVNMSGKEALNFHITAAIVLTVLTILSSIPLLGCITFPVLLLAGVATLVLCIIGALKASDGYFYKYPVNLRLVS
jgi:uncharacterized Tic20 family protein